MLLDFLFPKRCIVCKSYGEYLCADCFAKLSFETYVICLVCGSGSIDGLTHPRCRTRYAIDGVFCGVSYNGIAKKLVYVFKYQPYLSDTKQVLVDLLYESLIQKELFMQAFSATSELIPIPLSTGKHRQRGYNQAKLLADGLAKKLQVPVADILQRRKETIPQFGLTKLQRKENVKDAFAVKQKLDLQHNNTAFLIDDVLTTGSTLLEAGRMLKHAGIKKVYGITFARDQ